MALLSNLAASIEFTVRAPRMTVRLNSMFRGAFPTAQPPQESEVKKILFLNAAHGPQSLANRGAIKFLESLSFPHVVKEHQLWKQEVVHYRLDHAISKLKILEGHGTAEDHERFEPVLSAANELNTASLVLIATPMWNYTVPYILKQYIDVVVQPGINFVDTDDPRLTAIYRNRHLVVFSSAGAYFKSDADSRDSLWTDMLNPYLKQIFGIMGFTNHHPVFIQGTSSRDKQECIEWTQQQAVRVAKEINLAIGAAKVGSKSLSDSTKV